MSKTYKEMIVNINMSIFDKMPTNVVECFIDSLLRKRDRDDIQSIKICRQVKHSITKDGRTFFYLNVLFKTYQGKLYEHYFVVYHNTTMDKIVTRDMVNSQDFHSFQTYAYL